MRTNFRTLAMACSMLALGTLTAAEAMAQRGGRGGGSQLGSGGGGRAMSSRGSPSRDMQVRNSSRSNINHGGGRTRDFDRNPNNNRPNFDRDRNVNKNRDVNINRNIDIDIDHDYDWGDRYHPVARGVAAAVVTSAVIGSYYRTLPTNRVTTYRGSVVYYQCGSTWYQPSYYGSSVQYVVVNNP